MADFDRQKVATELRKFRKKLRQIEKLEDLERELTEEEYLKVMVKVKISYWNCAMVNNSYVNNTRLVAAMITNSSADYTSLLTVCK